MIRELIQYLTNKTSKEARAFGHLYESISLIEREKRCAKYWLSHRTQCKNIILETANSIQDKESILILGSGPIHEIPLIDLAKVFQRVDLVDIVHLKETKLKYAHLENVKFIETDITELETQLSSERKISNKVPTQFLDSNYSLVVSANLLSQLSYHLRNFLEKKASKKYTDEELDRFCYQVSFDHFQYLSQLSCPVLLITDIETLFIDKNEKVIDTQLPYINFTIPGKKREWSWNLAPMPELSKDYSVKMKVAAFILNY